MAHSFLEAHCKSMLFKTLTKQSVQTESKVLTIQNPVIFFLTALTNIAVFQGLTVQHQQCSKGGSFAHGGRRGGRAEGRGMGTAVTPAHT